MSNDQIEKLEQKQAQLKAKIQLIRNREATKQRKIETRKKILAGAAVLDAAKKDPAAQEKLTKLLDSFLKTDRDRKLFDLPVEEKQASSSNESNSSNDINQTQSHVAQPERRYDPMQEMRNKLI